MDLGGWAAGGWSLPAAGWLGSRAWRLAGRELWQPTHTAVAGRLAVKRERARRDRIVAVVTALPAGARLVDQAAYGIAADDLLVQPRSGTPGSPP